MYGKDNTNSNEKNDGNHKGTEINIVLAMARTVTMTLKMAIVTMEINIVLAMTRTVTMTLTMRMAMEITMEINIVMVIAKTMTVNDDSDIVSEKENSSTDNGKQR